MKKRALLILSLITAIGFADIAAQSRQGGNYNRRRKPNNQRNHEPNSPNTGGGTNTNQGSGSALPAGMNELDFTQMKASIERQSFASTKMTVAKQSLSAGNKLTVNQVREVMQLFSFESDKLEYAKFAFQYCIDKNKYYVVNDVFRFSSSVDQLDQFLQMQRK